MLARWQTTDIICASPLCLVASELSSLPGSCILLAIGALGNGGSNKTVNYFFQGNKLEATVKDLLLTGSLRNSRNFFLFKKLNGV